MFLPLFFTKTLTDKTLFWRNALILGGPYMFYIVVRSVYLLYRSLRWAYLVSNLFFTSKKEKQLADEWIIFVGLVFLWLGVMVYPLARGEVLMSSWLGIAGFVVAPYFIYKAVRFIFMSIGWAVGELTRK